MTKTLMFENAKGIFVEANTFMKKMMEKYDFAFYTSSECILEDEKRKNLLLACFFQKIILHGDEYLFAIEEGMKIFGAQSMRFTLYETHNRVAITILCERGVRVHIFPEDESGRVFSFGGTPKGSYFNYMYVKPEERKDDIGEGMIAHHVWCALHS
ncbi:MAG: hypothetical protein HGB03_01955 [Candidatus Yonathbacteria bacterium]|nr:hypothetical protein [Candidatus Yonathbacteria bacterium]NTW48023.1 hypothetical protein [Candidatus Yonathbacteria bacterium]